jgi:hypothetical protein
MTKRPTQKPDPDERVTKALKMGREYADWLERLAAHDERTVASLIARAVARYAAEIGFKEAPPERTP